MNEKALFLQGAMRGLAQVIALVISAGHTDEWVKKPQSGETGRGELTTMRTTEAPSAGLPPEGDVEQFRGEEWAYAAILDSFEERVSNARTDL